MFDLVFLLNPSSKSTSAQNESCRSSFPLRLLFLSNSKFLYEIWSFSGSNLSQNRQTSEQRNSSARHCARPRPYRRLNAGELHHASSILVILVVRAPLLSSRAPSKLPVPSIPFLFLAPRADRANPSSSSSAPAVVPRAPILPNPDPPRPSPPTTLREPV